MLCVVVLLCFGVCGCRGLVPLARAIGMFLVELVEVPARFH